MKFGRGVGGCRSQRGYSVVDRSQVARIDIADARVDVDAAARGRAAVADACESSKCGLRCRSSVGRCSRNNLQVSQSAHAIAVVRRGRNGVLYGGQVVTGEACDVQCLQLGQAGGRATRCCIQHGIDRVHHGLKFGRGVGGCGRQCGHGVIYRSQVGGTDIADTRIGVVCRGGGWAAGRVVGKSGQRGLRCGCCSVGTCGGHTLQRGQCVYTTAIVGRGCNGGLHGRQVVDGDARDGQCLQLGQAGGRATRCGTQHCVNGIDHGLKFGRGVGGCRCQCEHGIVDGGHVASGDSADTRAGVIAGGGGAAASAASKGGQRVLRGGCLHHSGIGQHLKLGEGIDAAAIRRSAGNGGLHRSQVAGGHARNAQGSQLLQRRPLPTGGCTEDGIDGIDEQLKFGRRICGCSRECGQNVGDSRQVGGAHVLNTDVGEIGDRGRNARTAVIGQVQEGCRTGC